MLWFGTVARQQSYEGMIMSTPTNRALVFCLALSIGLAPCCSAKISPEQLQTDISKAKILPPDTKITVAINASEGTVSTYKVDTATENDCKIDSVLIAKTAFDADSELSRITVLFYDIRIPNTYDEVTVTVGDVAAYGIGKVSKEQLMSAL
jgi:hypothetical protein